jgi:hypothetical protein
MYKNLSCNESLYFGEDLDGDSKGFLPSDLEILEEQQEKTFEEWKALFPIGSKARAKNDHGEYVKKGEIIDIEDYYNVPHDKVNNFIAVIFKKFFLCPIDNLEPIKEPSFKVGSFVSSRMGRKGIIVNLKLLPND